MVTPCFLIFVFPRGDVKEDSRKIQSLRDEFMAALQGSREIPLVRVKDC